LDAPFSGTKTAVTREGRNNVKQFLALQKLERRFCGAHTKTKRGKAVAGISFKKTRLPEKWFSGFLTYLDRDVFQNGGQQCA
jgi:hypothetical protein